MKALDAAARSSRRLGLDPVIAGIIAFFGLHMLIRLFGTSNFTVDDTEAAVHIQAFQLYYSLRNPPLFNWLFYGLVQVTGLNVFTIQLVKTLLLIGAAIFLYYAAKPFFRHRRALDAAIVSYGATAFYGWDIFQQFSHTVPLIFALAFTLWALTRVVRRGAAIDFVFLGLGLGLGLLSKYLFALYFLALVAAALWRPGWRRAILSRRLLLTLLAAIIVVSPLLVGLWADRDVLFGTLGGRVAGGRGGPDLESFGLLILLTAEFWMPFAVLLWIGLFRWPAAKEPPTAEPAAAGDGDFHRILRDATVIMVAAMFASFLFFGTKIEGGRYLVAILSLLPLAVFAGIDRWSPFPDTALKGFWQAAMVTIAVIAIFRFLTFLFVSPPFCIPRCVVFVDYRPVVERLDRHDGKQNVILSDHVHIASNLLRQVPDAKVVMDTYTGGSDLGIAPPAERNCSFVWFQSYRGAREVPLADALRKALRREPLPEELAAIGPAESVKVDWQTKLFPDRGRDTIVGIARIDSAQRICDGGRIPGLSPPPSDNSKQ